MEIHTLAKECASRCHKAVKDAKWCPRGGFWCLPGFPACQNVKAENWENVFGFNEEIKRLAEWNIRRTK